MEKGQREVPKWTLGGAARPHLSLEYRYIWATYSSTRTLSPPEAWALTRATHCPSIHRSPPHRLCLAVGSEVPPPGSCHQAQPTPFKNSAPPIGLHPSRALPPLSRPWCLPFLSPAVAPPSRTPAHLGVWLRGIGSVVGRGAASDRGWCWLRLPSLEVEQTTVRA